MPAIDNTKEKWKEGSRACRVLIIDDNASDILFLQRSMDEAGIETATRVFSDGAQALQYVVTHGNSEEALQPDTILLDLNLGGVGGETILQAIRSSRFMADVPIAIVTSSVSSKERDRILSLGVRYYIAKPADLDEFLDIGTVIREMLGGGSTCHGV